MIRDAGKDILMAVSGHLFSRKPRVLEVSKRNQRFASAGGWDILPGSIRWPAVVQWERENGHCSWPDQEHPPGIDGATFRT